jgi:glutaminase
MNRMELVPSNAADFTFARKLEQLGRCVHFGESLRRCQRLAEEIRASNQTTEEKNKAMRYLLATVRKLRQQHRESHLCYPFSIN